MKRNEDRDVRGCGIILSVGAIMLSNRPSLASRYLSRRGVTKVLSEPDEVDCAEFLGKDNKLWE
jgi:hypothetical protein